MPSNESDPLHLPLHQLDEPNSAFNTSSEFRERLEQLPLTTDRSHFQRLFSARRAFSDEQGASTARSKSARSSSSKKKTMVDNDWGTETPRLNRYVLKRHEDDHYGTLYTPRSRSRREQDEEMLMTTARSMLTDISLTSTNQLASTISEDSAVYCPTVEEVRRYCRLVNEKEMSHERATEKNGLMDVISNPSQSLFESIFDFSQRLYI